MRVIFMGFEDVPFDDGFELRSKWTIDEQHRSKWHLDDGINKPLVLTVGVRGK